MLIDKFAESWLDELNEYAEQAASSNNKLYLLIDGAFIPGLHKKIRNSEKSIQFSFLPGATEEVIDVSPFLTEFVCGAPALRSLLRACDGWPMVSVIETPESLGELAVRLAAWSAVAVDGQFFHFRFCDTRRTPAILDTLTAEQRAHLVGPAARWMYIGREGDWREFAIKKAGSYVLVDATLNDAQFAILVSDSQPDEIMMLLSDRGHNVFKAPSRSHALVLTALNSMLTRSGQLNDVDLLDVCELFWLKDFA